MAPREAPSSAKRPRPRKRRANVYDAVQGRVTQAGLIGHVQSERASKKRLRPDEVLYKRKNAPVRYHETDDYPAHTQLPVNKQLPSRDLVAAIDGYVSNLYAKHRVPGTQKAHKFINETGLLAMGILMEEMARDIVGETGNLAFTEEPEDNKEMMQDRRDEKFNAKNRLWVNPTEKKSDYKLDWERKVRPTRKRRRGGKFGGASDDPDIADDPDNLDVSLEQWKANPGHEADDRRSLPGRGVPAKLLSNPIYPPNLQTASDNSRTPEDAEDSEDADDPEDAEDSEDAENSENLEDSEDSEGSQPSDKNWLATLRLNNDLLLALDDSDDLEVAGVPNENSSATLGLVKDLPMALDHGEITDDSDNLKVVLEQLRAILGHGNDFCSALDDSEVRNDPDDSDVSLGQWSENLGHDDNFLKFFKGPQGPGGPESSEGSESSESSEGSKGSEFPELPELPEYLENAADLEGPEVTDGLDVEGVEGTKGAETVEDTEGAEDAEDSEFTDDSEGLGVTDDSDGARVSLKQWRANLGHHGDFLKYFEDLEDPEDPEETD